MKTLALVVAIALSVSDAFAPLHQRSSRAMTAAATLTCLSVTKADLLSAQEKIDAIINEKNCGPILVRLAWHDSGTFDANVKGEWPAGGGEDERRLRT
jgi:catalase (peroxidase I)